MKFSTRLIFLVLGVFVLGLFLGKVTTGTQEGFKNNDSTYCYKCKNKSPCDCGKGSDDSSNGSLPGGPVSMASCPTCPPIPDMSK